MTISLDQNPESCFPAHILTSTHENKIWRVAHTKSRREKALAHYLARAGIGYYLPMFMPAAVKQQTYTQQFNSGF